MAMVNRFGEAGRRELSILRRMSQGGIVAIARL